MNLVYLEDENPQIGQHVLYRCYNKQGALLYIGMTNDVENRLRQHEQNAVWFPEIHKCFFDDSFESREDLVRAEAAAIRAEEPLYNRTPVMGARALEIENERSRLLARYLDKTVFADYVPFEQQSGGAA